MTIKMDLYGKDRGNVSLPQRLQVPNFDERKLKDDIVNTQKRFYEIKIEETNKRIRRLEERNTTLENSLEDTDRFIKTLEEEKAEEISGLNSQIVSYAARIDEYKKQLAALEKSRIDDKFAHTAKATNIDEKYSNMRLLLTSQIKSLSAKMNVLQDYKSMQDILEKKFDMQNQFLIDRDEQVSENLRQIERKYWIDKEKLKKEMRNQLLDMAVLFQDEVAQHMPHYIDKLLSENIAVNNKLSKITESTALQNQTYVECRNAINEYERKIKNIHLKSKRFIVANKLMKSTIAMLPKIDSKADINIFELIKAYQLKEEQYIMNKNYVKNNMEKYETHVKYLEIVLYCEKQKLAIAKHQKRQISEQLQTHLDMLYDVKYVLMNLKTE